MLIRFVYLDEPMLAGFSAQIDGGLIAETKVRLVKKSSVSGAVKASILSGSLDRGSEREHQQVMSYPPEAQFQRLLAVAAVDPFRIDWIEVLEADHDFSEAQVGQTIAWECNADLLPASRFASRGGPIEQALSIYTSVLDAGEVGLFGPAGLTPEQLEVLSTQKLQAEALRVIFDNLKITPVAAFTNSDAPNWTLFGLLHREHLRVEDIRNERVIVVGKVKEIVQPGQTSEPVSTAALRLLQQTQQAQSGSVPEGLDVIVGPAIELDVLAVYR